MNRVPLLAAAIERRIAQFLESDDPRYDWLRPAVRRWMFLPLYLGWVSTLGIRPDGTLVSWDHDDDPENLKLLVADRWQRLALCQGAQQYPELRALLPARPAHAVTCETCGGTGDCPVPKLICHCGGMGWCIPGEAHEHSPG